MYNLLVVSHSILRWAIIVSFVTTLFLIIFNKTKQSPFSALLKKASLVTLIILHLQFLLGFFLYAISPKVIFSGLAMKTSLTRFFLVEHFSAMLVAVILITIGYIKSKKILEDNKKYNAIIIYYLIGFVIILAAIPWPFYNFGTNWF